MGGGVSGSNSMGNSGSGIILERAGSPAFTDGTENEQRSDPDNNSSSSYGLNSKGREHSRAGWGSFSTLSMRSFLERQENKFLESANQHLKGLFEWLELTSSKLRNSIGEKRSASNARKQLNTEIGGVDGSRRAFIERLLDICEEEPTKDSCIDALEDIVGWIRGLCQTQSDSSFTSEESGDKQKTPTRSKGDKSSERPNSSDVFPGMPKNVFDKIFSRCDYVLNEQSRFTTGRILELHNIFSAEASVLEAAGHANGVGSILGVEYSYFLMYEMNLGGNLSADAREVLKAFDKQFGTMDSGADSDAMAPLHDYEIYLKRPISFSNTDLLIDRVVIESDSKQESFRYNQPVFTVQRKIETYYSHEHVEMLMRIINDLQALCLANKLLVISGISPITYQPLFDGMKMKIAAASRHSAITPQMSTLRPDVSKSRSSENGLNNLSKSGSSDFGAQNGSSFNGRNLNRTDDVNNPKKSSSDSLSKPSYNVVYEISVGHQIVDLMVIIPSGSMARSKLSYAAFLYLQCLKNDELPWQQVGQFHLISVEQTTQGYGDFKVKKEVTFGIDSHEIDLNTYQLTVEEVENSITQSFSELFRNLDEIRIHQLLLYEASVDLYPTDASTAYKVKASRTASSGNDHGNGKASISNFKIEDLLLMGKNSNSDFNILDTGQ
eukprot:gene18885-19216_t